MSHKQFIVSDVNPNDTLGGGGCICDPRKQIDCKPPYVVFYGNDMLVDNSPHVVACKSCIDDCAEKLKGEVLSAGERGGVVPASRAIELLKEHDPVLPSPRYAPEDDEDVPAV